MRFISVFFLGTIMSAAGFFACSDSELTNTLTTTPDAGGLADVVAMRSGKDLFEKGLTGNNGRACETCHDSSTHFTITPEGVVARLAKDPADPLFNKLDADDPTASILTFEHLKKGLIRVTLKLPDNVDLLDEAGNVVTNADRMIAVWRGVPSIENTSFSAPFQLDGRELSLEHQANSASKSHSEVPGEIPSEELVAIADYEKTVFSSDRAATVARHFANGLSPSVIPDPEAASFGGLSSGEEHGRQVYKKFCTTCHGQSTGTILVDTEAQRLNHLKLGHDGNALFAPKEDSGAPVAEAGTASDGGAQGPGLPQLGRAPLQLDPRPGDNYFQAGFAFLTYLDQSSKESGLRIPYFPAITHDLDFPRYRLRFYTDESRTEQVTDLPPIPVTIDGKRWGFQAAIDPQSGGAIAGPNQAPQWWSTDPGRCLITGDPGDFEAFDMPQLRGIGNTPPYYHDNSLGSLEDVVDEYSRITLRDTPGLSFPPIHPAEKPGYPQESLSPQEKSDLVAFLRKL